MFRLGRQDSRLILEIINSVQPSIPWTEEHIYWQYFTSPAGPAKLYGIKDSGRLVAFYAAVAQRMRIHQQIVPARMIQDVMTHPDYRGRGYLHALASRCLQDMIEAREAGCTFPNEKSENSFRRNGWTELSRVPWRRKIIDSLLSSNSISSVFAPATMFGPECSEIWTCSGLPIGVERDASYLNWRYSKPGASYYRFVVNSADAVLVLKVYDDAKRRVLHICDLLTLQHKRFLLPEMLTFCELFAADRGAELLTAWLPESHPYADAFNSAGLTLPGNSKRSIFVHGEQIADQKLWHLTQGDSDIY